MFVVSGRNLRRRLYTMSLSSHGHRKNDAWRSRVRPSRHNAQLLRAFTQLVLVSPLHRSRIPWSYGPLLGLFPTSTLGIPTRIMTWDEFIILFVPFTHPLVDTLASAHVHTGAFLLRPQIHVRREHASFSCMQSAWVKLTLTGPTILYGALYESRGETLYGSLLPF